MYPHDNVFQIYYNIGRRLPFIVKRCKQGFACSSSIERMYSKRDRCFLVEKIEPKGKYGKAYGKVFVDGVPNNEYSADIEDNEIPCAGCGDWVLVDVPGVDMKEVFPPRGNEYVIEFGKHKGKTLREIYESDPEYIFWLLETDYWFHVDFRDLLNIPNDVVDIKPIIQAEYDRLYPMVKIDDTITFGKYRGRSYKEVYEENPEYIHWLLHTNNNLRFDVNSFRAMLTSNK